MGFNTPVPENWKLVKLSDLGEVNRGRSRHRPRDAAHLYGGPYPFVQTGDIKASGGRITTYTQTYSKAGLAQSRLWPAGTMCITIAANIAETGILTFPACFPDSVIGFVSDETKCNAYFVEYVFQMRLLRKTIQAQATGSVQYNINLQTLERLQFPIPNLEVQNRIAEIFCAFDDKIELNRQINQTLEQIAQAIFKSWFVDFEPVKAKIEAKQNGQDPESAAMRTISGKTDEQLDQLTPEQTQQLTATAALFSAELIDSDLGPIPKGWEVERLSKMTEIIGGGTPKKSETSYWGGNIPWFSVKDAPADGDVFVIDTKEKITELGMNKSSTKLLSVGVTIISARGTVGRLALVGVPMAMNQSCYGVKGIESVGPAFNYFNLKKAVSTFKATNSRCCIRYDH